MIIYTLLSKYFTLLFQSYSYFLSLLENLFFGNLKCLVFYSLRYEFFILFVDMDTATVLTGDCLKYVNALGGDGLDDSMM